MRESFYITFTKNIKLFVYLKIFKKYNLKCVYFLTKRKLI